MSAPDPENNRKQSVSSRRQSRYLSRRRVSFKCKHSEGQINKYKIVQNKGFTMTEECKFCTIYRNWTIFPWKISAKFIRCSIRIKYVTTSEKGGCGKYGSIFCWNNIVYVLQEIFAEYCTSKVLNSRSNEPWIVILRQHKALVLIVWNCLNLTFTFNGHVTVKRVV